MDDDESRGWDGDSLFGRGRRQDTARVQLGHLARYGSGLSAPDLHVRLQAITVQLLMRIIDRLEDPP